MKPRYLFFLALLVLIPTTVLAADNSMDALKARFKERLPEIQKLKRQGTIGETAEGYVAFVKQKQPDAEPVVTAENNDRTELYKQLAAKLNTTPEKVAERNAVRNFDRAKSGEWIRPTSGKWEKKP